MREKRFDPEKLEKFPQHEAGSRRPSIHGEEGQEVGLLLRDLITLRAPAIRLQTFNSAGVNDIGDVAGSNTRLYVAPNGSVGIGSAWAVGQSFMAAGSFTIGNDLATFGGGSGWNTSTAALLLETNTNTEIAVHHTATRVASLMYYEGAHNRITIGRDMGRPEDAWGRSTP